MTEHKKIAIEYQMDQPFIICADCPWYDKENKFLLPYDENVSEFEEGDTDIRNIVKKKLAEHNEKIGDIYSKTYAEVAKKSVIKWLGEDIWRVEYFHSEGIYSDTFGELKKEKVEEVWQNITKKIVGKY